MAKHYDGVVKHYGSVSETPCFPGGGGGETHRKSPQTVKTNTVIVSFYVVVFLGQTIKDPPLDVQEIDGVQEIPSRERSWHQKCLFYSVLVPWKGAERAMTDPRWLPELSTGGSFDFPWIFNTAGSFGKGFPMLEFVVCLWKGQLWPEGRNAWKHPDNQTRKKAHKHKLFGPVALGTIPGTNPVCHWDKPRMSQGQTQAFFSFFSQ